MNTFKNKIQLLNATTIKIIAIVLMVFDHIHQMWNLVDAMWLKWLGRPVFALLLFIIAESLHYTRNRKKLMTRLLLGAWLMVVLNLIIQQIFVNPDVVLMNSAFMTFFVTGLYIIFYDLFVDGIKTKNAKKIIGSVLLCFIPVITLIPAALMGAFLNDNESISQVVKQILAGLILMLPNLLFLEGGISMVAIGVLFYILRKWRWAQMGVLAAVAVLYFILRDFQWMMIFAAIPILLYNGEKGRGMKNFFYIFYPAHIYILYIVATVFWK